MNRIYRIVWSAALGRQVVTSELACSRTRSGQCARGTVWLAAGALLLSCPAMAEEIETAIGIGAFVAPAQSVMAADPVSYFAATGSEDSDAGAYADGSNALAAGEASAAVGEGTTALGAGSVAYANRATAVGSEALAIGDSSTAVGGILDVNYQLQNSNGVVLFQQTSAAGLASTALGAGAQAEGDFATVSGAGALGSGKSSVAIGGIADDLEDQIGEGFAGQMLQGTQATGRLAVAVGGGAQANAYAAISMGGLASATGIRSTAIGYRAVASEYDAMAVGDRAQALGEFSNAFGSGALALYDLTVAVGSNARAGALNTTALGANALALVEGATAVGYGSWAAGKGSVVVGDGMTWNGDFWGDTPRLFINSVAIGTGTDVWGSESVAIGSGAKVGDSTYRDGGTHPVDYAVALGAGSYADRDNTVSVGRAGYERQIVNVAAGTAATDAVNKSQLDALAGSFGDVSGNFAAFDLKIGQLTMRLDVIEASLASGGGEDGQVAVGGDAAAVIGEGTNAVAVGNGAAANGENGVALGGDAYAHGPNDTAVGGNARVAADGSTAVGANIRISAQATNAVAIGESASVSAASGTAVGQGASVTASNAVALGQGSVADRADTVSVGATGSERQITHVAAGTQATDAANVGQVDTAVSTARAYTDARFTALNDSFDTYRNDVDRRLNAADRRMDRQGAMSAAMLNMATNAAGGRSERGRIAVGAGFQSGEQALSVGYARKIGERGSFSLGGAFSGGESSAGVGFGIDL